MRFVLLCLSFLSLALFGGALTAQAAAKTYTNSVGIEFVLIPAGEFLMGSDREKDPATHDAETPQHPVRISKPFYLGTYEVTLAEWDAVMGNNPPNPEGGGIPVIFVSWGDAQEFVTRLNEKEGHTRYRLPTEAEWEYAARAGSTGAYSFGDDADSFDRYAWYTGNSGGKAHPVGQKEANAWGLYDMYGNVFEWVHDWNGRYADAPAIDPEGPSSGSYRMFRGGSWNVDAKYCRSASRYAFDSNIRDDFLGFRLALSLE
jgi:formylglycine-generating enzyme required for sulfatase activity